MQDFKIEKASWFALEFIEKFKSDQSHIELLQSYQELFAEGSGEIQTAKGRQSLNICLSLLCY